MNGRKARKDLILISLFFNRNLGVIPGVSKIVNDMKYETVIWYLEVVCDADPIILLKFESTDKINGI